MSYSTKRLYSLVVWCKILGVMLFGCLSTREGMCLGLLLSIRTTGDSFPEDWLERAVEFLRKSSNNLDKNFKSKTYETLFKLSKI